MDDEIIVCACGFATTVAPIVQAGLKPVFVDIVWDDLNWNLEQVLKKKLLIEQEQYFLHLSLVMYMIWIVCMIFLIDINLN